MSDDFKPRHWFIQKPTAHNCPYRTNSAVFQEFQPTIVDNPGGEWIKVWSSQDLSKYLGMGVTRWVEVREENARLTAENDQLRSDLKLAVEALGNVEQVAHGLIKSKINEALRQIKSRNKWLLDEPEGK